MKAITEICKEIHTSFKPRYFNPSKPVSFWSEPDRHQDVKTNAFVIILRTKGCAWHQKSGCSMCGYFQDSAHVEVSDQNLIKQYEYAMEKYNDEQIVKIFNSGSFLDEKEISHSVRDHILTDLSKKTDKINIESRPDYVSEKILKEIKKTFGEKTLEIGIGLETAQDNIRNQCINKGFSFNDYKKAAEKIKKQGFNIKTYVLIKPPFITEKHAINDAVQTVDKIKNITDTISFNPTNIQKYTLVEYIWRRNQYRPPWLWSIIEILKQSKKITKDNRLQCDIVGGGSRRGAHNCEKCNNKILTAINDFSINQKINVLKNLDCECKEQWLDQLEIEPLSFGSYINSLNGQVP